MSQLDLKIVTPERLVYEAKVDSVSLPTEDGELTILKNHIPLVAPLRAGEIRSKMGSEELLFAVSTGFVEVRPGNQVIILADTAEREDELDLQKIEEAKAKAQALLSEKRDMDDVASAAAVAALERELARYRVAVKKRR